MGRIARNLGTYVRDVVLKDHPGAMVLGARAVGKTTALSELAATTLDLSDPAVRAAVDADPTDAIRGLREPVLIDEWQEVPEILVALKKEIDSNPRPGRFVVTGSVHGRLGSRAWPATGRLIRRTMYGFSQGEMEGLRDRFVEACWEEPEAVAGVRAPDLDRTAYLERACRGGFPPAVLSSGAARARWLSSYVEDLTDRDAALVGGVREPRKLRTVLNLAAARTAQLLNKSGMARDAGVEFRTLAAHLDLLADLFIIRLLAPWSTNLTSRISKAPKLHVTDAALAAYLLGKDPDALRLDAVQAGALLETFAVMEVLRQLEWSDEGQQPFFYRDRLGHEVDLLLERRGGEVVAVEVKSGVKIAPGDLRGMRFLRDRLGRRFHAGVVLFTGPLGYRIEDRIYAAPLAALWRAGGG